jgi:hypothetical protein
MDCTNCQNKIATKSGLCRDCVRHKRITSKFGTCFAYSGSFDVDDNPVDKSGFPIINGIRKCGNRDCINRDHIILALEFERFDSSYTMGVRRSTEEIWLALLKEKSSFPVGAKNDR